MKRLILVTVLGAAILLFLSSPALADTVDVGYEGVGPGLTVYVSTPHYVGGALAGVYNIVVNGAHIDAFCVDLTDNPGPSFPNTVEYGVVPLADAPRSEVAGVTPMGAAKASLVKKLWAANYSPGMSNLAAAALQVAIWEVITDVSWNLGAGDFQLTTDYYSNSSVRSAANSLLTNLDPNSGSEANLIAVVHPVDPNDPPTYQDYTYQVPEPATLLFLGAGLVGLGLLRRRRV